MFPPPWPCPPSSANGSGNLPNILTYGRMVAVPVVVGCLFSPEEFWMRWLALAIFVVAGVTDFFDGYLARAWSQQSSLGRMLDPIADKLLVAACLLMLVADQTITGWSIWAAIVILCREILVSGLREFLAELRVSRAGQHASPNGRPPCSSSRSASWSPGRPARCVLPGTVADRPRACCGSPRS